MGGKAKGRIDSCTQVQRTSKRILLSLIGTVVLFRLTHTQSCLLPTIVVVVVIVGSFCKGIFSLFPITFVITPISYRGLSQTICRSSFVPRSPPPPRVHGHEPFVCTDAFGHYDQNVGW